MANFGQPCHPVKTGLRQPFANFVQEKSRPLRIPLRALLLAFSTLPVFRARARQFMIVAWCKQRRQNGVASCRCSSAQAMESPSLRVASCPARSRRGINQRMITRPDWRIAAVSHPSRPINVDRPRVQIVRGSNTAEQLANKPFILARVAGTKLAHFRPKGDQTRSAADSRLACHIPDRSSSQNIEPFPQSQHWPQRSTACLSPRTARRQDAVSPFDHFKERVTSTNGTCPVFASAQRSAKDCTNPSARAAQGIEISAALSQNR